MRHDELRLAPAEPQLDRAGRQLDRDLLRGGGERVLEGQPDRRVQGGGEALRERSGLLAARLRGGVELSVDPSTYGSRSMAP